MLSLDPTDAPRAAHTPNGRPRIHSAADYEAQAHRERSWVAEGAERFMARQERTHTANATATVAGQRLIKRAHERFVARLETHRVDTAGKAHAMKDRLLPILAILDADHVAAVTLMLVIRSAIAMGKAGEIKPRTMVAHAQRLGEALEHDIRLRAWAKDPEVERRAIERMKRDMEASPRAWRRRAEALRAIGAEAWSVEDHITTGVDLMALLVEAAPDVFEAPVVKYGCKTFRLFRLTDAASDDLAANLEIVAASRPRLGFMLVPPRPWRYEGT